MSVSHLLPDNQEPNLHILMIEDSPEDFALIMHELGKSGLRLSPRRVETEAELVTELQHQTPDVVFSDHACGAFDSFSALARVRSFLQDVPFILITGALGDELMVKSLDHGVDDWVSKDRLPELLPSVLRALRLGEEKHRMRRLELERDQLRAELAGLRQVQGLNHLVPVCASCKKIRNERNEWMTMENYFEHRHGLRLTHGLCVACVTNYYRSMGVLPPIDE